MKTIAAPLLAVALIATAAPAASAYSLSPPDTSSKLRGLMTFYPNNGGGMSFKCKVTFYLKTKGFIKSASVDFSRQGCAGMSFAHLPWGISINNLTSGQFGTMVFTSAGGSCSQTAVQFQDNSSGVWTLPPGGGTCIVGTFTSTPPVTIVP